MNTQNNISFKGLYTVKPIKVSSENLSKLSEIVNRKGSFIDKLEKEYDTDVFISEKFDNVRLKHNTYGEMGKYLKELPIIKFFTEKEADVIAKLENAMTQTKKDWEHMNYLHIWQENSRPSAIINIADPSGVQ